MSNNMTGEDLLVWLCRDTVSAFHLRGGEGFKSAIDIADEYGCTQLLVVYDKSKPSSAEAVDSIRKELERRESRLGCENFRSVEVTELEEVLEPHANSCVYIVPDSIPLPKCLASRPKFYQCANEMLPLPAMTSYKDLGAKLGPARWTEYFLLGLFKAEQQLEHVRTILANEGKAGVPQYVLITGETGTGKSFIARNLPRLCQTEYDDRTKEFKEATLSERMQENYGYLHGNCASLSPELADALLFGAVGGAYTGRKGDVDGLIESAKHGILFLDEVGDMPLETQGKLLTALEEKIYYRLGDTGANRTLYKVECRIVFGTNHDLAADAKEWEDSKGTRGFRKDLLYRINSCQLELPPLRTRLGADNVNRRDQVFEEMTEWYCADHDLTLTRSAYDAFRQFAYDYTWPGNFRDVRGLFAHLKVDLIEKNVGKVVSRHAMTKALSELFADMGDRRPNAEAMSLAEQIRATAPPRERPLIDRMFNVCKSAFSRAEAGRAFFAGETKGNYSDTFGKYLARWGLTFDRSAPGHLKPQTKRPADSRGHGAETGGNHHGH